ncbi:hypothetical protein CC1G_01537 [Coprinopsis cinerea okayama7|uniref:Uncharacterized protein n=1 Tax=Coprinopsis cinerea (strain Okayama-7 / 130 / ATCC MYA-4618 / FGSC 9003) TaxID=240176 RepID=A8NHY6_COPC7|nr:hypothetical protein CC1G_01537 [Coprinopsis cinerea okayama7\|eukprot:XP_001833860.2 hypothetical protein CC1G_01537 [Coprinopsis cinerea okayama7\
MGMGTATDHQWSATLMLGDHTLKQDSKQLWLPVSHRARRSNCVRSLGAGYMLQNVSILQLDDKADGKVAQRNHPVTLQGR